MTTPRETLEAERKACQNCYHRAGARLDPMYLCPIHNGVLHGIELTERATLERVIEVLEDARADVEDYFNELAMKEYVSPARAADMELTDAIAAIRAAFPETEKP